MCLHHDSGRAVSLDHGDAHDHDHDAWTRRDFLLRTGLGVGAAVALGSTKAYAYTHSSLLQKLATFETDRVLVLIQLKGGNDGLNTVVPLDNDVYRNARQSVYISPNDTVSLDSAEFGLHPALAPLRPLWGDGQMAIVQAVGYDTPSLSHFASTDIWTSGNHDRSGGGWAGRSLRSEYPTYEDELPAHPPAVQIGANNPLLFQSDASDLSMMVGSASIIDQIAAGEGLYDPADVAPTPAGTELGYVRSVTNAANTYIDAVQVAASTGVNKAAYPNGSFGENLAAVARLIKGGLSSRIYLVSLGSFDTHSNQLVRHQDLLDQLARGVAAFYQDLGQAGHSDRVATMTFSEFGRRVSQNGSAGTDHGTAAPLFAFGPGISGGFYGGAPDLSQLDNGGNYAHAVDFRQTYASVLGPWLGLGADDLAAVLGNDYTPVDFVRQQATNSGPSSAPLAFDILPPAPNPVRHRARVTYVLPAAGSARVTVHDTLGRRVAVLADGDHRAGVHAAELDAWDLASGVYVVRLESGGSVRAVQATVAR